MTVTLNPPHHHLTFLSPLSEERAGRLVQFLAEDLRGTVLDIGCGWAELLLRVVAAVPGSRGVGIDLDAEAIAHGQRLADRRGLADRVALIRGDARTAAPEHADAAISIGASHVWATSEDHSLPMAYDGALRALRAKVSPGARVVYGEAVWSRPPTPQAAHPLGGRLDTLSSLADVVEIAVAAGFSPVAVHEATTDEWDAFESGHNACYAAWLDQHGTDDPGAPEVRARATQHRDRYLRGYRGFMGLAYLQLTAV